MESQLMKMQKKEVSVKKRTNVTVNTLSPKIKIWILIDCPNSFPTEEVGRSW